MKIQIPASFSRRGILAAMALLSWSTSALADGRIDEEEWTELITERIGPQVRDVVVERGEALRAAREARGTSGTGRQWTDTIKSMGDAIRFRDWATSAFADGRIDEGEIVDLIVQHCAPAAVEAVARALNKGDEDEGEEAAAVEAEEEPEAPMTAKAAAVRALRDAKGRFVPRRAQGSQE